MISPVPLVFHWDSHLFFQVLVFTAAISTLKGIKVFLWGQMGFTLSLFQNLSILLGSILNFIAAALIFLWTTSQYLPAFLQFWMGLMMSMMSDSYITVFKVMALFFAA